MTIRAHQFWVVCLAVACMTRVLAAQPATRQQPPVDSSIDAAMQKFVDDGTIAGAVTLVAQRGRILHLGAVGLADIESQREMRNNAIFSIASMTKPIVATGMMMLVEEGKVGLEDPVSKYLPAFAHAKLKNGDAVAHPITIRHLLTHTSGLGGSQTFTTTLEAEVDQLAQRPLDFQPGERWQYSPGITVIGRVIEVVTGQPLAEFLKMRIFEPCGMNQTTFFPNERQRGRIATLYEPSSDGKQLVAIANFITEPEVVAPNPSGGLYSTARDMYRFYQMVLRGGRARDKQLLSMETVTKMTSRQTGDLVTGFTPGNGWGLGWCVVQQPQGVSAPLSPGTFGHGGAFGTQGWVDPTQKSVHVLMIQRSKLANSDDSPIRRAFHAAAAPLLKASGSE